MNGCYREESNGTNSKVSMDPLVYRWEDICMYAIVSW